VLNPRYTLDKGTNTVNPSRAWVSYLGVTVHATHEYKPQTQNSKDQAHESKNQKSKHEKSNTPTHILTPNSLPSHLPIYSTDANKAGKLNSKTQTQNQNQNRQRQQRNTPPHPRSQLIQRHIHSSHRSLQSPPRYHTSRETSISSPRLSSHTHPPPDHSLVIMDMRLTDIAHLRHAKGLPNIFILARLADEIAVTAEAAEGVNRMAAAVVDVLVPIAHIWWWWWQWEGRGR
jgi:hypothetical protein